MHAQNKFRNQTITTSGAMMSGMGTVDGQSVDMGAQR